MEKTKKMEEPKPQKPDFKIHEYRCSSTNIHGRVSEIFLKDVWLSDILKIRNYLGM